MWLRFHPTFQCCFFLNMSLSLKNLYESTLCLNGFQSSLVSRSDFITLCMYLVWLY